MKKSLQILFLILTMTVHAQSLSEKWKPLPAGSVKPVGWLREQMQNDLNGFVGQLDRIVPELINDPIYGAGRLQKHSAAKNLGNLKAGDAEGEEQYKWWNSETQSNWWDGYLRHVFLLDDQAGIKKAENYVRRILDTQDEDGYIGIYDRELRYRFQSENGELWAKASLYRGLLAYYEYTADEQVFKAVTRAVDNVMQHYPLRACSPFESGTAFNGGVSHGLTFTDVLERLYFHTGDARYREYALFLYEDFSRTNQSEADAQLKNLLDAQYQLKSHGVHTFEHLRTVIIANYAKENKELAKGLENYLKRIEAATTISGGAIGDEWIAARTADATHTGYEYCSLQELLDSYGLLLQKTGTASWGDAMEKLFYNAAQGSRNPNHSAIAYLKTDNSYEMTGTRNGAVEPHRKQTRYKYSAAHQDVAVCCNPNAGRIAPYFLQHAWMQENPTTFVATLLMPNVLHTKVGDQELTIENRTAYPYENKLLFKISQAQPARFCVKIRKPHWAQQVNTAEKYRLENDYIVIEREFAAADELKLSFDTEVTVKQDPAGQHYFCHGALLYALPIAAKEIPGKCYIGAFTDYTYEPLSIDRYAYIDEKATYRSGMIETKLKNTGKGTVESVQLIPLGKTILRQVTF